MTMHTEWDEARSCAISTLARDTANEDLDLAGKVTAPFVLALGGDGGGCLAVEGTAEQLRAFAARLSDAVARLIGDSACSDCGTTYVLNRHQAVNRIGEDGDDG